MQAHFTHRHQHIIFLLTLASLLALLCVIPFGFSRSSSARAFVSHANLERFEVVKSLQQDLMNTIMSTQSVVATLAANLDNEFSEMKSQQESIQHDLVVAREEKKNTISNIRQLSTDMEGRLDVLIRETKQKVSEIEETASPISSKGRKKNHDDNHRDRGGEEAEGYYEKQQNRQQQADEDVAVKMQKRWLVKWHSGAEGVMTSEKMRTEMEATTQWDSVGEVVAKKMLFFDANRKQWVVIRKRGGTSWLLCISDDDKPQTGACKAK